MRTDVILGDEASVMALTALENELLTVLRGYLAGEKSFDDFRSWEVSVTDSDSTRPEEEATIERLALMAETVMVGAAEMADFDDAVRAAIDLLEA